MGSDEGAPGIGLRVDFKRDIDVGTRQVLAGLLGPFDHADRITTEDLREPCVAPFVAIPEPIKIKVV
jgi:hypothetical protein